MSAPKKAVREIYMDEEKRNGKRSHGAVMALIFMLTIFTWGEVLLLSRPTPKEPAVTSAAFPDIPAVVEKCMPSSVIFQVRKTVLSDPSDSDSEKMQVTEAASGIIWEDWWYDFDSKEDAEMIQLGIDMEYLMTITGYSTDEVVDFFWK